MKRYLLRRGLAALFVVWMAPTLVFVILHVIPGDPAQHIAGELADVKTVAEVRAKLGLDRPVLAQYLSLLGSIARLDFGTSFSYRYSALRVVVDLFPATLELTAVAAVFAIPLAMALGILSALRRNTWLDYLAKAVALFGLSTPSFWLGIMLILVVSVQLGWLPSMDRSPYSLPVAVWRSLAGEPDVLLRWARHIVLPAITLGAFFTALIARMTRTEVLENLGRPFVLMAKAKGQSALGVLWRHVLPNSLIPIVTIAGVQIGQLLGGALVTEAVFTWPGMGRLIIDAIFARDFPVIQTAVFVYACIWVSINFLVDVLYLAIDPRVTLE